MPSSWGKGAFLPEDCTQTTSVSPGSLALSVGRDKGPHRGGIGGCAGLQAGLGTGGVSATWTYLSVEHQAQRAVPWQGSELLLLKIPLASVPVVDLALASEPRGSSSSAGQRKRHVGEGGKKKLRAALGSHPGKPFIDLLT